MGKNTSFNSMVIVANCRCDAEMLSGGRWLRMVSFKCGSLVVCYIRGVPLYVSVI